MATLALNDHSRQVNIFFTGRNQFVLELKLFSTYTREVEDGLCMFGTGASSGHVAICLFASACDLDSQESIGLFAWSYGIA